MTGKNELEERRKGRGRFRARSPTTRTETVISEQICKFRQAIDGRIMTMTLFSVSAGLSQRECVGRMTGCTSDRC